MKYNIDQIIPTNKIIVQPGTIHKLKHTIEVADPEKNKGKKPEELHEMKKIVDIIESYYQVGTIVSIDPTMENKHNYTVGESIIYDQRRVQKLDILTNKEPDKKCPVLLMEYDIVGRVNN